MKYRLSARSLLCVVSLSAFGCADSDAGVQRNVDATSQPIRAAVHSNAAVSSKLAKALSDQTGNLFYSPLSIEAVSGMLFAGAAGNTATQLGELLDAQDDPDALHQGLGALLRDLSRTQAQYTLSVANRLWAVPGLKSSPDFVDTMRDDYNAPTALADFAKDPESARTEINRWVSQQTASKIPELLQQGQLTKDTVMAVVNAIYFKADWATAFDASRTQTGKFYRADSTDVPVQMMSSPEISWRFGADGDARWVELPYRTGDVSFIAYTKVGSPGVPIRSVQELQADLENIDLDETIRSLELGQGIVEMPRFSMRSRIDLVPVFKQLGVTDMFDVERADFTKLAAGGNVFVDPFVHEAAVWVDEKGTTAAAATAGGVVASSAPAPFRLDHPFLFLIRDNLTGAILFRGQLADPSVDAAD